MAVSSSISARKYSSSSRRKTSRSLCGVLGAGAGGDWTANTLPGGSIIRLSRRAAVRIPAGALMLLFDFNSAPKGYMVLDVAGCRFRVWIVPGGVLIFLSVDQQAVVSGLTLPGARRNRGAGPEVFPLQGAFREV